MVFFTRKFEKALTINAIDKAEKGCQNHGDYTVS